MSPIIIRCDRMLTTTPPRALVTLAISLVTATKLTKLTLTVSVPYTTVIVLCSICASVCPRATSSLSRASCTRVFDYVRVCLIMYACVLLCTRVYDYVRVCLIMYACVLLCTRVYDYVRVCLIMYACVLLCTRVYDYVRVYLIMYACVLLCTRVYDYVRECVMQHTPTHLLTLSSALFLFYQ